MNAASQPNAPNIVKTMGLKSGQWHTTVRIVAATLVPIDEKPVPPEMEAKLQKTVGTSFETDDCIGSTNASTAELVLPGITIGAECSLEEIEADEHHLRLKKSCGSETDGFRSSIVVNAHQTNATMTADVETSSFSKKSGYDARVSLKTSSSYRGSCTPH